MPPAEAPARCARKIGTRGSTQGDEIESTPARKAATTETSTPMRQPYHRRLGAAIDRILLGKIILFPESRGHILRLTILPGRR